MIITLPSISERNEGLEQQKYLIAKERRPNNAQKKKRREHPPRKREINLTLTAGRVGAGPGPKPITTIQLKIQSN